MSALRTETLVALLVGSASDKANPAGKGKGGVATSSVSSVHGDANRNDALLKEGDTATWAFTLEEGEDNPESPIRDKTKK